MSAAPERAIRVDLGAIRANADAFARMAHPAALMAVVKADGFGHGAVPAAIAALEGGASWLGVAHIDEGLELRRAGLAAPVLAWLHTPRSDFSEALQHDLTLGASSVDELRRIAAAAVDTDRTATLHLKVDTGLGRNGAMPADWPGVVAEARRLELDGLIRVEGVFSHLSMADTGDGDQLTDLQRDRFVDAVTFAERAGLRPLLRHLANTAATLRRPDTHFDLVRVGLGIYGLSPLDPTAHTRLELARALSMRTVLASVKRLPPGHGVSYGARFVTGRSTRLGLVPVGYGDGLPRTAKGICVAIRGRAYPVVGVIAMDQLLVDLTSASADDDGDAPVAGDEVVVIAGSGSNTVDDWARAAGTINYEIVTRLTRRAERVYV